MDQLSLKSLLRCDNKGRFSSSSSETAKEAVEFGLFGKDIILKVGKCSKSNVVLGNGKEEKGAVSPVYAKEPIFSDGLFHSRYRSLLVHLRVELHDSLCVLSGIGN